MLGQETYLLQYHITPSKHRAIFVFCYMTGENGPICLRKSLCLPGNWSKLVHKLILHENQLELVSRS